MPARRSHGPASTHILSPRGPSFYLILTLLVVAIFAFSESGYESM
jgi:hypothetical protein